MEKEIDWSKIPHSFVEKTYAYAHNFTTLNCILCGKYKWDSIHEVKEEENKLCSQ